MLRPPLRRSARDELATKAECPLLAQSDHRPNSTSAQSASPREAWAWQDDKWENPAHKKRRPCGAPFPV